MVCVGMHSIPIMCAAHSPKKSEVGLHAGCWVFLTAHGTRHSIHTLFLSRLSGEM